MQSLFKQILFIVALCFNLTLSVFAQDSKKTFTLVIDAGHGGHDPGAVGKVAQEKTINLNVALKFGNLVKENCSDVKVIYTRSKDVFIPLQERANIANRNKADLFVSIHTNAAPRGNSASGTETYTLGMARAGENLAVAKRENAVITLEKNYKETYEGFDPNSPESYIIFELMQDKNMKESVNLAKHVQQQFKNHAQRRSRGTGVYQAGFLVLRQTSAPSILTELGFISNSEEEAFLASDKGQVVMAQSLYNAFINYRKSQNKNYKAPSQIAAVDQQNAATISTTEKTQSKDTLTAVAGTNRPTVQRVSTAPRNNKPTEGASLVEEKAPPHSVPQRVVEVEAATTKSEQTSVQSTKTTEIDTSKPTFKVQITMNAKKMSADSPEFKGLAPIECYVDGGSYKYTYGATNNYSEAQRFQVEARKKFPQAFVVAFIDGKRVNLFEAIKLSKNK